MYLKLKKFDFKLKISRTKNLESILKKQIFSLKNSHYKFSLAEQKKWFNQNINSNDIHLMIIFKKKIIGYNCLRIKKAFINNFNSNIKISYFFLFDTLIVDKKFRNLKASTILLKKSSELIEKKFDLSFLICERKMINYYKNFKWRIFPKNKILSSFTINKKTIMFFSKKINIKNIKKIEIL